MPSVKSEAQSTQKSKVELFNFDQEFGLESGSSLPELKIAYTTHGKLNAAKNNVVWVFHALTANADPTEWWPDIVGKNKVINTDEHFIVCANILGSCYGTTGPDSIEPVSGEKYGLDFPLITIKDIVRAHELLRQHLGIIKIKLGIGGSMGGHQLLEWAIDSPSLFENIYLIATNAHHSAWGIAFNSAQRLALEADPTLAYKYEGAGEKGLKAARAIAMLSYRNQNTYRKTQSDFEDKIDGFKADSYQAYQGEKLVRRFSPQAYWTLSKAMDSHNVGRGRKSVRNALTKVKANTIVAGIKSDILFPFAEQRFIAKNIKNARFELIDSLYGHDGFLIESEKIKNHLLKLLK
ncbi:homoserine O-acetyltransferase family protein [Fulvivirga lutea]|uniref:Homoserine O-acetyltransferase n=1 Tax=Fulvivirga lutea TaxID=2810512 RepID=A0A975A270_9BACT|nr:homoserine O-acetyltransferase [Fulvivirga lutea]QSE98546.1 homoserine O-acetyltransferase [Fulvivirga lutea]